MLFSEDVIHRGSANNKQEARFVIFLCLVPEEIAEKDKDTTQQFELNEVREIYGRESKEYTECYGRCEGTDVLKHLSNTYRI